MPYNKITKENIDHLLFELAKEYHKLGRKAKGEIVIVGGAAIVANYGFRNMSEDADAITYAESHLKQAIINVAKQNNLPDNWLNSDFVKTRSYSDKLGKYAKDYKEFANCIQVKTIEREYLIAMKLASFRKYKNDISDIVGILNSEFEKNNEIQLDEIKQAIINLYGSYDYMVDEAKTFIESILENRKYINMYQEVTSDEKLSRGIVLDINKDNTLNAGNINFILSEIKYKRLDDLYDKLGIELTNDKNINASLAQRKLIEKYNKSNESISLEQYTKKYFGDLYFLHNLNLSNKD